MEIRRPTVANEAERLEILKMVQSKQISPEDGARLIKALVEDKPVSAPGRLVAPTAGGRWFKVVAEEPGGERVNVSVPLGAVPMIMRFVERFVPAEQRDALR